MIIRCHLEAVLVLARRHVELPVDAVFRSDVIDCLDPTLRRSEKWLLLDCLACPCSYIRALRVWYGHRHFLNKGKWPTVKLDKIPPVWE